MTPPLPASVGISCDPHLKSAQAGSQPRMALSPGWGTPNSPSKPSTGTFSVTRHLEADSVTFYRALSLSEKLPILDSSTALLTLVQGPVSLLGQGALSSLGHEPSVGPDISQPQLLVKTQEASTPSQTSWVRKGGRWPSFWSGRVLGKLPAGPPQPVRLPCWLLMVLPWPVELCIKKAI